jgi:penicillin-binding protein 1A
MSIFSWKGEIDTVMKPIDSIRYYKHFMLESTYEKQVNK